LVLWFYGVFFDAIFYIYSEFGELQQTYQVLLLDVQGIIESHLHLPQSALTTVPLQQTTSTGFLL